MSGSTESDCNAICRLCWSYASGNAIFYNNSNFYFQKNTITNTGSDQSHLLNCINSIYIVDEHFILSRKTCLKVFIQSYTLLNKKDLAEPKSGALFSLFSSPSLFWIKAFTKLFSTGCRGGSLREFRSQSGGWERRRIDEIWNLVTMFS